MHAIIQFIQGASLRARLRLPSGTLAHKETIEQNNVNEAGRGPESGAH